MKIFQAIKMAPVLLMALALFSCGSAEADKETTANTAATVPQKVNMAYIDSDSLLSKYNFAKDVLEAGQRAQNRVESARNQKMQEIQRFAAQMEQKYKNNQYLTESSFNADQQKLQQMNNDAERYMANLQNQLANEMGLSNKQLNDSINKCVNEYAKKQGLSVVLRKEATWYLNGVPDVTEDIVKILNERYNKVEKK